jgi:glutamine cyclotransferase
LDWDTVEGDAGDYTATVESDDDTATASVTVNSPTSGTLTEEWVITTTGDTDAGVAILPSSNQVISGTDTSITAHALSDGSENWSQSIGNFRTFTAGDVQNGGVIYQENQNDTIAKLNASDGTENWSSTAQNGQEHGNAKSGRVAVFETGFPAPVTIRETSGGSAIASDDLTLGYGSNSGCKLSEDGNNLLAWHNDPDGDVEYRSIDAQNSTTSEIWSGNFHTTTPGTVDAVANGSIYIPQGNGDVEVRDPADGSLTTTVTVPNGSPIKANGTIDGEIVALAGSSYVTLLKTSDNKIIDDTEITNMSSAPNIDVEAISSTYYLTVHDWTNSDQYLFSL